MRVRYGNCCCMTVLRTATPGELPRHHSIAGQLEHRRLAGGVQRGDDHLCALDCKVEGFRRLLQTEQNGGAGTTASSRDLGL